MEHLQFIGLMLLFGGLAALACYVMLRAERYGAASLFVASDVVLVTWALCAAADWAFRQLTA